MLHVREVDRYEVRCDRCLKSSGSLHEKQGRVAVVSRLRALGWKHRPRVGSLDKEALTEESEGGGVWSCPACASRG